MGWDADTARLSECAESLFTQGREIILVGHSYGGIPACVATRGNGITERAAVGKSGGFRHIVFVCAFALPASGLSNLTAIPDGQWLPWHHFIEFEGKLGVYFTVSLYAPHASIQETNAHQETAVCQQRGKKVLYNDLPADTAQSYFESLLP